MVSGHVEFYREMTKAGKKPILGIEAYQAREDMRQHQPRDAAHLILLAKNNKGLQNLWNFSTETHRDGFYYYPRCDWRLLDEFKEGLICTSACMGGLLQKAVATEIGVLDYNEEPFPEEPEDILQKYLDIFKDDFYIELHTYDSDKQRKINEQLVSLATKRGVPLVYSNDSHYAFQEQWQLHEAVMALQTGKKLRDATRDQIRESMPDATEEEIHKASKNSRLSHPPCLYILSEEEVRKELSYIRKSIVDQAIDNSDLIASQCEVTLPERRNRIPIFTPAKGFKTNRDMFYELAYAGYKSKIKHDEVYWERFQSELEIIVDAELVDYFLIVQDYVTWARKQGIMVGPGRGSVGGSLIAFLLEISDVDPIRYGLIFERFYNAGRELSLPDIDTDFEPDGVDKVYAYLADKYGSKHVADLGTITRMQGKQAIKDLGRVLSVPLRDTAGINSILDRTIDAGISADWDEIYGAVGPELAHYKDDYPQLFEWAESLYDYVRNASIHASAVVVADEPLDGNFPLRYVAKHQKMVSQWDMHIADDLGYLKVDLLRLRNLKSLAEVNNILKAQGQDPIDFAALQYIDHPPEMYELLDKGLTVGIFQVEEGGSAKQIAKKIRPRSVEELGIIVAMNRPGPLRSGAFDKFVEARKTGVISVDHPMLLPILTPTLGTWLYQESVIEFMVALGYTLSEADHVRKIVGKKLREELAEEEERFRVRAQEFMSDEIAETIWSDLVGFASYAFNKSHSIAYGIMTLWTLYAKHYYPKEFILAGIRTEKGDVARWVEEAGRMGIKVLPPDVNESGIETTLVKDKILYGLKDVKGMGVSHSRWVVQHRPYENYDQFLVETRKAENKYKLPNSGIMKILLDVGRAQKLWDVGAFDGLQRRVATKQEKIEMEEELLGTALSDDSAKVLQEHSEELDFFCEPYDVAANVIGPHNVAGVIKEVRERKTKKGEPMAFVKIAQDADELEFAVWQHNLARFQFLLKLRVPIVAKLKKTERGLSLEDAALL